MKTFRFISTLRFLSISEPMDYWVTLMPGIDVTNNKELIKEIIDEEFKNIAGLIEFEHFIETDALIYCEIEEKHFRKGIDSDRALFIWLLWLDALLRDLWLIKDNAVICESAFCKMNTDKDTAWTRNYLSSTVSKSSGHLFQNIELTLEELKAWDNKSEQVQNYLFANDSTYNDSFTNTKFSRIGRSLRFIQAARTDTHPAVKLAHYCSAFESLFSTDSAELSHKLSERVAIFLKDYDYDPLVVFDDMKLFYGIRSKVSHGDSLKSNKEKQLSELSEKCDSYLREIINIVLANQELINIFDGKKEQFETFFKLKILSNG